MAEVPILVPMLFRLSSSSDLLAAALSEAEAVIERVPAFTHAISSQAFAGLRDVSS
ncbi:MAG: hypothetical protein AAFY56_17700 [Pseudomonadota bacterium]